jgi:hypothetical protein
MRTRATELVVWAALISCRRRLKKTLFEGAAGDSILGARAVV